MCEGLFYIRAQNFYRHLSAIGGDGKVDLGNGSRGHRGVIEFGEHIGDGFVKFGFNGGSGIGPGKRR